MKDHLNNLGIKFNLINEKICKIKERNGIFRNKITFKNYIKVLSKSYLQEINESYIVNDYKTLKWFLKKYSKELENENEFTKNIENINDFKNIFEEQKENNILLNYIINELELIEIDIITNLNNLIIKVINIFVFNLKIGFINVLYIIEYDENDKDNQFKCKVLRPFDIQKYENYPKSELWQNWIKINNSVTDLNNKLTSIIKNLNNSFKIKFINWYIKKTRFSTNSYYWNCLLDIYLKYDLKISD